MGHMTGVMCHVSRVMGQMSDVSCRVFCVCVFGGGGQSVELVGGCSVINGAYPK